VSNTPHPYEHSPNFCHRCEEFGQLYLIDAWQPVCYLCARGMQIAQRLDALNRHSRKLVADAMEQAA
jgi:hypothetical protein